MLRSGSVALISAYQRYLSPRKGYCCAYRAHTGTPRVRGSERVQSIDLVWVQDWSC